MRYLVGFSLATLLLAGDALAQPKLLAPEDSKFVVQLDVSAFRKTELGEKLVRLTQQMAQQEIGGDDEELMSKVEEALGFNPLDELKVLTLVGRDFDSPEENLSVLLQMGDTTGNLEGLVMAAPGYSSQEYDDHTIHSAQEDDMGAHAAVYTAADGNKIICASTEVSDVKRMLDDLGAASRSARRKMLATSLPKGVFAQVTVLEFPKEVYEEDPSGNLVRMIEDVTVTLGEAGDDFEVNLVLTTENKKRAEQFMQLAQGAKALVSIFEDEIGKDEDAQMIMSLLDTVQVDQQNSTVEVHVAVPQDLIITFLRDEADLPL